MSKKEVWFGVFEFGDFKKDNDLYPIALVRRLDKVELMYEDDIEDEMQRNHYDAYLLPFHYKGEIYYAKPQYAV